MIQLGELTQIAERDGVEARTVERDYVLNQILVHLYGDEDPRADDLVFKGGTLLRACYFDEYRYSADLDFSLRGSLSAPDAEAFVGDALVRCSEAAAHSSTKPVTRTLIRRGSGRSSMNAGPSTRLGGSGS
jgi:predicted nucleotidyltransferase component of viral defense system